MAATKTKPRAGSCQLCGESMPVGKITNHLKACIRKTLETGPERHDATVGTGATEDVCHVRVLSEAPLDGQVLHILARPTSRLSEIDALIRQNWCEPCCDERHDSRFTKGRIAIDTRIEPGRKQPTMDASLAFVARQHGTHIEYVYDLNNPLICRIDTFWIFSAPEAADISVIARNEPGDYRCIRCGRPARPWCPDRPGNSRRSPPTCAATAPDSPTLHCPTAREPAPAGTGRENGATPLTTPPPYPEAPWDKTSVPGDAEERCT